LIQKNGNSELQFAIIIINLLVLFKKKKTIKTKCFRVRYPLFVCGLEWVFICRFRKKERKRVE